MKRLIIFAATLLITLSASARKGEASLTHATPESVGMNGEYLTRTIDSIATHSIAERCFPGCQILVARKGKIVFSKSYGHHTYEQAQAVENHHLYDMASCTKVLASTIALMRLVEQGQLSLDKPLSLYFEEFRGTDKEQSTLRELLAHQSGIRNLSFGRMFFEKGRTLRSDMFSRCSSEAFPYRVCDSLYACKDTHAMMFRQIVELPLSTKKLRYACTSFHCYPTLIERITGRNYEEFLYGEFYRPLGIERATYNPLHRFSREEIVPTEVDNFFRKGLVHGFVHDEAAASLGGVSGNAGLFANAESLAPILQMLLNGGLYNGKRYLKQKSIRKWTSCQYPRNNNYRGLGFDRRRFSDKRRTAKLDNRPYYYAPSVSKRSYGHSGFTGTMIWADPKEELIFIFLTNRIHPSRDNKAFSEQNPRAKCHEAAYEAIRRFRQK